MTAAGWGTTGLTKSGPLPGHVAPHATVSRDYFATLVFLPIADQVTSNCAGVIVGARQAEVEDQDCQGPAENERVVGAGEGS